MVYFNFQTKEEGKALLRTIAQKRSQQEEGEMQVSCFKNLILIYIFEEVVNPWPTVVNLDFM